MDKNNEKPHAKMKAQELHWQKLASEEKEIRALIYRDFPASLMNNTKWTELADALCNLRLHARVKFVDVEEPMDLHSFWSATQKYWDSHQYGPFLVLSIEWLDIETVRYLHRGQLLEPERIDYTEEIAARLRQIHVPYYKHGSHIRIVGHVRKTAGE